MLLIFDQLDYHSDTCFGTEGADLIRKLAYNRIQMSVPDFLKILRQQFYTVTSTIKNGLLTKGNLQFVV